MRFVIARDRAIYVLILAYFPSVLAILNNFTVFVMQFVNEYVTGSHRSLVIINFVQVVIITLWT